MYHPRRRAYRMRSFTGDPAADTMIRGQFEIPWMAVDPEHQGRGTGRRILDALLGAAPQPHAWLVPAPTTPRPAATKRSAGR